MKRRFPAVFLVLVLSFFSVSLVMASQPVPLEAAKKAAEYHGESIFKKDLKVCAHELLHWAWGEPAVYVFTLMREGDSYPPNILLDNTLLQGAYLVSRGKELEGYTRMAQADRYMTVYVGATTDMPSFVKAHAGLPEHVVARALMGDAPADPYWIYGDLFHILLTSKSRVDSGDTKAAEIHLNELVDLKELGSEKPGAVPAYAEQIEWGRFLNPGAVPPKEEGPELTGASDVLEGKHQLMVAESNLKGDWKGCSPAAFYNCLKYLEKRKLVNTYGKSATFLQDWISICYRTDKYSTPEPWGTAPDWILPGSTAVFRGLAYDSQVTLVERDKTTAAAFLTAYAKEINLKYPCHLGGADDESFIYYGHSTTGIGYWRSGSRVQIILHDGWKETPNQPVYVPYSGYPEAKLQYPIFLHRFHPLKPKAFKTAAPKIMGPNTSFLLTTTIPQRWQWEDGFSTLNKINFAGYAYDVIFRDAQGVQYKTEKPQRVMPFFARLIWKLSKTFFKAGTAEITYKLIDDNGHLISAKKTIKLLPGTAPPLTGTWLGTWSWVGKGANKCKFNDHGAFSMRLTQTGNVYSGPVLMAEGVETRDDVSCKVTDVNTVTGWASGILSETTLELSFYLNGSVSTLDFDGTAWLNGNILTASFVRTTGGVGSFTLTKQENKQDGPGQAYGRVSGSPRAGRGN